MARPYDPYLPVHTVAVDPHVRDRRALLAALDDAHAVAAHAVGAALDAPPPAGSADPRWYADPAFEAAVAGTSDAVDAPLYAEVALWPEQLAALRADELPPGVGVVREPAPRGYLRRAAPFGGPRAAGTASPVGTPAPAGSAVAPGRAPVEYWTNLGTERSTWPGPLAIDAAYEFLAALVEERAAQYGDIALVENDARSGDRAVRFEVRVGLDRVGAGTSLGEAIRQGERTVALLTLSLQRLEAEVAAVVAGAHAEVERVRAGRPVGRAVGD